MLYWIISIILGIITIAFAPGILIVLIKFLSGFGRKFPTFADAIAILTAIVIGAYLIAVSMIFASFYHGLFFK